MHSPDPLKRAWLYNIIMLILLALIISIGVYAP